MAGEWGAGGGFNNKTLHVYVILMEYWCFLRGCFAECAHHSAAVSLGLWVSLLQDGSQVNAHQGSWLTPSQVAVPCSIRLCWLFFRYLHPVSEEDFEKACWELKLTQSVWTIDLAYLMRHLDIRHCFCTQTLGVDKGFRTQVSCTVKAKWKVCYCSGSYIFSHCSLFIRNTLTRKRTEWINSSKMQKIKVL